MKASNLSCIACLALRRYVRVMMFLLTGAFATFSGSAALAQVTCTASFSALSFGAVSVLQGNAVNSAGSLTASCSGFQGSNDRVRMCFTMGAGAYPLSGSLRQLGSGSDRASFQIFSDAARTVVWDAALTNAPSVTLTRDAPSVVLPVYGQFVAGQRTTPPGAYSTVMNVTRYQVVYNGQAPPCTSIGSASALSFAVNATVPSSCSATATNLNFGSVSSFSKPIDAVSAIQVLCTNSTPYHVRLNAGASGLDATQRAMTFGPNAISYDLFRDASRTLRWGSADGVDTVGGVGTANSAGHTVYGRIPAQAIKPPGTYTDTVVVTISFL
jgi:spore coat protein U-like protein